MFLWHIPAEMVLGNLMSSRLDDFPWNHTPHESIASGCRWKKADWLLHDTALTPYYTTNQIDRDQLLALTPSPSESSHVSHLSSHGYPGPHGTVTRHTLWPCMFKWICGYAVMYLVWSVNIGPGAAIEKWSGWWDRSPACPWIIL